MINEVSSDVSLNIREKLKKIFSNHEHEEIKESVRSYFDIRNGLEHNKGIAKTDRTLAYMRLALVSTAGYEIIPPQSLGPNEGILLTSFTEIVSYDKGGNLIISHHQLEGIVLNLIYFTLPIMKGLVSAKINGIKINR